jgi:hypothetical protein
MNEFYSMYQQMISVSNRKWTMFSHGNEYWVRLDERDLSVKEIALNNVSDTLEQYIALMPHFVSQKLKHKKQRKMYN